MFQVNFLFAFLFKPLNQLTDFDENLCEYCTIVKIPKRIIFIISQNQLQQHGELAYLLAKATLTPLLLCPKIMVREN